MDWHHGGAGFEYGVGWTSGKSGKKRRYSVPEVRRKLLLEIEQVPGGPSLPRVFLNKKPGEVQLLLVRKQEIIHFL